MPLDTLQRQLGHRHIETTLIYNEVRDGRLQREYKEAMKVYTSQRTSASEGREDEEGS